MKQQIVCIINPISGTHQKQAIPGEIARSIDATRFDYRVCYTTHAGHAAELAAEAARRGTDIVVAVGGDGTINEVARSLVHTSTALGIIPCGSGNGLARHLQIPQNPKKAIDIINRATVHCLDYGRINGRPFFCTCGVGFDAFVSQQFAESGKRGVAQYIKNTLGSGFNYKPETYVITDDKGTQRREAFLIACANASQYGNNAYIAPEASMKDGLMDLVVMQPFPPIEGAQVALQMFTKTLQNNSHVLISRTRHVHIERQQPGVVHCDGEPLQMGRTIDVEIIRQSFNVVINPEAHSHKKNYLQDMGDRFGDIMGDLIEDLRNPANLLARLRSGDTREASADTSANGDATTDVSTLARYIDAQDADYDSALEELRSGRAGHWRPYLFPQLAGTHADSTADTAFDLTGREEAEAFLYHPLLGARLQTAATALLQLPPESTAAHIFGEAAPALQASMTLFSALSDVDNLFERVLIRYYDGRPCRRTLQSIGESATL
jgi:YegS/Rv2252/BmrU family lipid kinase